MFHRARLLAIISMLPLNFLGIFSRYRYEHQYKLKYIHFIFNISTYTACIVNNVKFSDPYFRDYEHFKERKINSMTILKQPSLSCRTFMPVDNEELTE